jgi:ubiquitin-protein ligase
MSMPSGANKRLITEITKLKALSSNTDASSVKFLLDKSPLDEQSNASRTGPASSTQNIILGRILPSSNVYSQAAFQIELKLPADFPFKPPEVRFVTPIYHPNVDDQGKICVDLLNSSENWKPTTPLVDVVKAVVDLIDNPKIDHALNAGRFDDILSSLVCYLNNNIVFISKILPMNLQRIEVNSIKKR